MVCRLCLSKGDESIVIFSEEKIQKYITKFLHLEISPEDPVSKVICNYCWDQLDSFQKFCIQIEEAQKSLKTLDEDLVKDEVNTIFVKDLSPVKQEDPTGESNEDDTSFNVDLLNCMDGDLLKVELNVADENNTLIKSNEPTPTSRTLREKRKTTEKTEPESSEDEYDAEEDDEEEESESEEEIKRKKATNAKRKLYKNSKKGEQNNPENKKPRTKKPSRAMLLAREHDEIIKKYMKLTCDICSIDLADFNDLQNHFRFIHNRTGYAVCCKKKLKNRGLTVDHINAHNNPDHFKCKECGKVMSDRFCMQRHMLSFHPTEDLKTFQCSYCPEKLASQYLLDLHSIKHVPEDKCTFICKECGKGFPTNSTLNSHIKRKHSTAYDRMCEICAKLFRHKSAFERHMEEHDGIVHPQVQCEECGSWLKDKSSLQKHMNNKHDHKQHICNICGKHSTSKSALQSHINYMHEITPVFKCTFCDKSFKKAIKLKEHVATHTGEVLYTCPHCPTKFNAKSNLHSHRKKMHREEWEANRRCSKKEPKLETKNAFFKDEILRCLDEDILQIECLIGQEEIETKPPTSIPSKRVTRQTKLPSIILPKAIEEKRMKIEKEEIEEHESSDEEEEDEPEGEQGNEEDSAEEQEEEKSKNITKRSRQSKKGQQNNQKNKEAKSEKFLKNMKTTKENDEFIRKHMKLTCDLCTTNFPDFTKLKHHFRVVHKRRGYVLCCNRQLKKRGLIVDHIFVHNDPEYFKCKECGKVLSDRSCLQRHIILFHQAEELKTFQCTQCPKKFPTKKLLDLHVVKHNECTFICSECGKGFPTKSTMDIHFKRIHSTLCDRMCEICAKLIKGKTAFARHMEEHEGIVQPRVECKECGSWLKDKNSLRKHMYSKHDGKTHNCKICGKNTPSYSALYSHMKYMHELSNMFNCTFCDKSFKKAIKLKEHVATHTGGFLYTCPHCPTTFNAKTNLHSHRKKMHREEWEANRRYAKKAPFDQSKATSKALDSEITK